MCSANLCPMLRPQCGQRVFLMGYILPPGRQASAFAGLVCPERSRPILLHKHTCSQPAKPSGTLLLRDLSTRPARTLVALGPYTCMLVQVDSVNYDLNTATKFWYVAYAAV